MNCINLKQKMNRTVFCKCKNKKIAFKDCNNCPFKEFKQYKQLQAKTEYKYKPKKGKCSRYYNNISIIPKSTLYFTEPTKGCEKHHIFGGISNRPKSEQYGLFVWITEDQHRYYHDHPLEMLELKKTAQATFMKCYNKTVDEFIKLFGRNFL